MVKTDDYYQLLGVSRLASQEAIKRAFHFRVKNAHPDLNQTDDQAHETTRRIIDAYQTLRNPRTRRQYDLCSAVSSPAMVIPEQPRASFFALSLFITTKKLAACVVFILGMVFLAGAIMQDRPPVFKAVLVDQGVEVPPRDVPMVVEPEPSDCLEWYQAREYQLTLASGWATSQIIETYSEAVRRARHRGDKSAADFYQDSITRIRKYI
jgi:hypothetical protein